MKDEKSILSETKFKAAVNVIRSLPKNGPYQPSHDMMLKFYGLYKQATEGPCKEPKPSFFEVVKGYKWKAWNANFNMSKTEAMDLYVEELKKIVETMSYTDDVALFIQTLGPFYEYVDIPALKKSDRNHNISEGMPKEEQQSTLSNIDKNSKEQSLPQLENEDRRSKPLVNGHRNGFREEESIDKVYSKGELYDSDKSHPVDKQFFQQGLYHTNGGHNVRSALTSKKFVSDTESDEEYSEPAECLEAFDRDGLKFSTNYGIDNHNIEYPLKNQNFSPFQVTETTGGNLSIVECGTGDPADGNRLHVAYNPRLPYGGNEDLANGAGFSGDQNIHSSASSGNDGGGGRRGNPRQWQRSPTAPSGIDSDSRILFILRKIQQDIESVAHRLDAFETQAVLRHNQTCGYCQRHLCASSKEGSSKWWPFPELSPKTTFALLSWPLILGGAATLLQSLRKKNKKLPF